MNDFLTTTFRISSKERIPFRCISCGECCRHVQQSVPLESLDVFRLTKLLKAADKNIDCMDDFLERYAEMALIGESGYFMFMLRVTGPDDACIFLQDNRCMVHKAKPRTCRIYPFVAGPDERGGFEYLVSKEKTHHFKGPAVNAKSWMKKNFSDEDREFLKLDVGTAGKIAQLLLRIPEEKKSQAVLLFWRYKYSEYELEKPFMEQYQHNILALIQALKVLLR